MKNFRLILLVFNILAALGLILTTLAGLIPPSTSFLPSVMAYGFLPMLLVNLVFTIIWLAMGRWEFLISAGTILIRISYIGLFFQIGGNSEVPSRAEHPDMVVLMSYNVHGFGGMEYTSSNHSRNAENFLKLLREHQPDILCMQEYTSLSEKNITDSLRTLGYNHSYGARGGSENPSGTVVFSKLPITFVKNIDRQKILVELLHGKRKFRICCVHMDSYAFDENDRSDIAQMSRGKIDKSSSRRTLGKGKETVLRHEEEWKTLLHPLVADSKLPFLLAGDMNDIASSWLYSQITDYLDDTYCDQGSGFCTTYNGSFPRFRIDMIFHSKEFSTLCYRRITTDISDHYPVLVALEFNKNN